MLENYHKIISELKNEWSNSALIFKHNPIVRGIDHISHSSLENIIKNYSCLSNNAIQFLTSALIRSYGWDYLYKEIEKNIEEEKGSKTNGIPHLIMMYEGYLNDLNINVNNVSPHEYTEIMLSNLNNTFLQYNRAFIAGAILAFESIAIEEFKIIEKVIVKYLELDGKILSGSTKKYIDGHKFFEIEHSKDLENAIEHHLTIEHLYKFKLGYWTVCRTLNDWWNNLHSQFD